MTVPQPCVMMIDVEPPLQDMISRTLRGDGFRVIAATQREALALADHAHADLIVLNLLPPHHAHPERYRQLRQHTTSPILALLAPEAPPAALSDLLQPGAYLHTPFQADDLLACVDTALRQHRRLAQQLQPGALYIGGLEIDLTARRLLRRSQVVRLSRIEWALLDELVRHRGVVLTHSTLLRRVWGDAYGDETAYLHVYIGRLRRKLEDEPSAPRYLLTEPGIGYRFAIPELGSAPRPCPPDPAPAAAQAAPPSNLTLPRTAFFGREQEVATARKLLQRAKVRLVSLIGTGGIGKTRLAQHAAASLRDTLAHGVWFVALAAIRDPELVLSAIAQTLGLSEASGQPLVEQLQHYLHDRHLLLVLDNFEQVLPAARAIAALLEGAPQLKLLVTSRVPLHLAGEYEFPVTPLALPNLRRLPPLHILADSPAVALFAERAQLVTPDFALNETNAASIAEICVCLEGLPLAIELAAARTRLLSPKAMLARLNSRLGLLTGGLRDAPDRHRSLRAVIEWSYELLDPGAQTLFARLGVFVGGGTLEAIEAVCGTPAELDVLAGLETLLDNNLLWREQRAEEDPRFGMLETIREYALERLAERGETELRQRRHTMYYLTLAESAEPELEGPQQKAWRDRLEEEHHNVRAALRWAKQQGAADIMLRFSSALWHFWGANSHSREGRQWMEAALLAGPPEVSLIRAQVLHRAGVLADVQSDFAQATLLLEESLVLYRELGDKHGVATVLNILGSVMRNQGDIAQAGGLVEESLEIWRELGERRRVAGLLFNMGLLQTDRGDYFQAQATLEESLLLFTELDEQTGIAMCRFNIGNIALYLGDYDQALTLCESSLVRFRALGQQQLCTHVLTSLGRVALEQGHYSRATELYEESLLLRREMGLKEGILPNLEGLGLVAAAQGMIECAARLLGAAMALRGRIHSPLLPAYSAFNRATLAAAHVNLDQLMESAAWAAGQVMTLDQAISYALGHQD